MGGNFFFEGGSYGMVAKPKLLPMFRFAVVFITFDEFFIFYSAFLMLLLLLEAIMKEWEVPDRLEEIYSFLILLRLPSTSARIYR